MFIFSSRVFAHDASPVGARRPSVWIVALVLFVSTAVVLMAAQADKDSTPKKSPDDEWQEVKTLGVKEFRGASGKKAQDDFAQELVRDAEKLQQFQAKHADHAQAKEAKRLEALALIQAWQAGDESRSARRNQLVQELRKDAAMPPPKRSEIVAFADNIAVEKRTNLSLSARLAAYEEVARNLAAEFPDLPDAYEALVQIAKDSPDARAPEIAKDVLAMAGCPAPVKKEAQAIARRYALVGQNAVEPTKIAIAKDNPFVNAAGSRLVVYTWATTHALSIERAKELPARVPSGTKFVGVCLDQRDLAPAKDRAKTEQLPGDQIYDWLGRRGEIAEVLGALDPGLIYVIDSGGVLRSVSAQRDLTVALAALAAE